MIAGVAGGTGVLDTVAGPTTLCDIDNVLGRVWSACTHVPDRVRLQMGIAVAEIGANIIEHAGRSREVRLRMEVRVLHNEVRVCFVDDGIPAQIDLAAVRGVDEWAERGRGLAMAQAVLDRLCYTRNLVNHWTLVSRPFG
jgi:serine/threonine-protein kinase RsbW